MGQGRKRQVALGSVGQHSSLSLVVSRRCHYIVLRAGAFDGLSPPLSQHSQQHLEKQQPPPPPLFVWWRIAHYPTHSMRTPRRKSQSCVAHAIPENAPPKAARPAVRPKEMFASLLLRWHRDWKQLGGERVYFVVQVTSHFPGTPRLDLKAEVTEGHCLLTCSQAPAQLSRFPKRLLLVDAWVNCW